MSIHAAAQNKSLKELRLHDVSGASNFHWLLYSLPMASTQIGQYGLATSYFVLLKRFAWAAFLDDGSTLRELAAGVNKTLQNFSASFCGHDLLSLLYAETMAYRSTKSVSVSIAPDLHQCAMDLVELNKRSGNQPVTFSAMAEAGVADAVLKALPRLKKAGVKIPDSIKSK